MCAKLPCAPKPCSNHAQEKANLRKTKVNATKIRKVHANGYNLHTGKEWRP